MFKFEHWDDESNFYTCMELREEDLTHDYVAEKFTDFLRSCSYIFDHFAVLRLVDSEGVPLPSFEEKLQALRESWKEERDEEDSYTFPVM